MNIATPSLRQAICGGTLWLLAILCQQLSAAEALDRDALDELAKAVAVQVLAELRNKKTSQGSGMILNQDGYVATNEHVVRGHRRIWLRQGTKYVEATVVGAWKKPDLAIVRWHDALRDDVAPVTLALSPKVGDELLAVGFPAAADELDQYVDGTPGVLNPMYDAEPTRTPGAVTRMKHGADGRLQLLYHHAPISDGNSGGPLLDACGRVIGVNAFSATSLLVEASGEPVIKARPLYAGVPASVLMRELENNRSTQGVPVASTKEPCLPAGSGGVLEQIGEQIGRRLDALLFKRDATDGIGRVSVDVGGSPDQTDGSSIGQGVTAGRSLTVYNQSSKDVAAVRVKPWGAPGWREVAGAPIMAGNSARMSLLGKDYGDRCRFDILVVLGERTKQFDNLDLCSGQGLMVWTEAPFLVRTVPPDALLKVVSDDGRTVWDWEDGRMPPSGVTLRHGNYLVEARAKGYEAVSAEVPHEPDVPSNWSVEMCNAGAEKGERFSDDCKGCPEMVVIPAGCFWMGQGEERRRVRIGAPFAVGTHEVTYAQWKACVRAGGCPKGRDIGKEGRARRGRPAVNVSWDDAQSYVRWLTMTTGKGYRLLSEAEWEYVARAGTDNAYSWGEDIGVGLANCNGCGSKWDKKLAPVGSFSANHWGLHDMHGNVREWVEDCWKDSYAGSPRDGLPWKEEGCPTHVVRGGFFFSRPVDLKAAARFGAMKGQRAPATGFRVARTLEQ